MSVLQMFKDWVSGHRDRDSRDDERAAARKIVAEAHEVVRVARVERELIVAEKQYRRREVGQQ